GSPWNNSSGCDEERRLAPKEGKKSNVLPLWGNERTMNLNPLILTNIQSSHYFKVNLYELKTYHEVIDEIYYKVSHLEPWEKGSRKTAGQTGMCGGVSMFSQQHRIFPFYLYLYYLIINAFVENLRLMKHVAQIYKIDYIALASDLWANCQMRVVR
ncbi:PR38B factor, partial [Acromyrmex charruanus]